MTTWYLTPLFTEHGMTDNNGSVIVMEGSGDDARPVAHALLTIDTKRGQKHTAKDPQRDRNARLIAAAPDLLAALKRLAEGADDVARDENTNRLDKEIAAAEAAIAKAEG